LLQVLSVFSEESVPFFGPTIPTSREFTDHEELRHFLLVKRECFAFVRGKFHRFFIADKRLTRDSLVGISYLLSSEAQLFSSLKRNFGGTLMEVVKWLLIVTKVTFEEL
uniref:DNA-directed RNA polymerase n=1 Tax=Hydatigena taeniaeformis TaxID=6205 RepID=A0A0R3WUA5_HYDTA